jgi:hypothetical protein
VLFSNSQILEFEKGFLISEKHRKGSKTHFSVLAYVVTPEKFKCLLGVFKCVLRDLRFFRFSGRVAKKIEKKEKNISPSWPWIDYK